MMLKGIYKPIERTLADVEQVLSDAIKNTGHKFISEAGEYLLKAKGKRLRPALVILSAKAANLELKDDLRLLKVAAAFELVHMASLLHDDVIDKGLLRHNRPTVNSKWGQELSIALGDYLYSVAFEMISDCGHSDIIRCVSSATKEMCEGEFLQVSERDNLDVLKEHYFIVVKKKTASLFVASCQAGTLLSDTRAEQMKALNGYGSNFGIGFQIVDDYLDLVSDKEKLGKSPGQDIRVGEMTLPILNLLESAASEETIRFKDLLSLSADSIPLSEIRRSFLNSDAASRTRLEARSFMDFAKKEIDILSFSPYKESLMSLADLMVERCNDVEG